MSALNRKVTDYFINMTQATFDYREKNKVVRKDFMQLLLQLRNGGKVGNDGDWNVTNTSAEGKKTVTIEECAAQSFLFYAAGYDTSSSALTYALYELARNQPLLRRVQNEIDEVLERHNQELTYDCIQDMKLLEWCILGKYYNI